MWRFNWCIITVLYYKIVFFTFIIEHVYSPSNLESRFAANKSRELTGYYFTKQYRISRRIVSSMIYELCGLNDRSPLAETEFRLEKSVYNNCSRNWLPPQRASTMFLTQLNILGFTASRSGVYKNLSDRAKYHRRMPVSGDFS